MTDAQIAKKAGLTVPGVRYKRERGWTDEEILAGERVVEGESLVQAQLRKETALADLRQLEVDEKRGELIPLAEATASWVALVQLTRAKMTAIPNAICDQLAASTDAGEIRLFLMREIDERLTQLAEEFQETARDIMGESSASDSTAATPDGDGVGGEIPDTEQ